MDVVVSFSDGTVDRSSLPPAAANGMFASYQYEVDHRDESADVRGDVVPVHVIMVG